MFGSQVFATQGVTLGERQVASPQGAMQSPAKKQRPEENFLCMPVTVRQLEGAQAKRAASGEELKFFGVEPKELILVAAVESAVRQGSCLEMTLNDGTGRMKARYFITEDKSPADEVLAGRYVSVFGGMRSVPAVHFAVNGLRLVEAADEVSYHLIEVAHTALRMQRGAPQAPAEAPASSPAKPPAAAAEGAFSSPPRAEAAATAAAAAGPLQGAQLRAAVLEVIRGTEGPEGVAVAHLVTKFSSTEPDVRAVIKELVDSGDVFQTTDDDHFALLG